MKPSHCPDARAASSSESSAPGRSGVSSYALRRPFEGRHPVLKLMTRNVNELVEKRQFFGDFGGQPARSTS
jgi:hypothetical protein